MMNCMLHLVFLTLLLTTAVAAPAVSLAPENLPILILCKNNEKYMCGATCIETCTYKPQLCLESCTYGCFCADGYVRQSDKTGSPCVERKNCSTSNDVPVCGENDVPVCGENDVPVCGESEEYTKCGSACPSTCADLRYPLPKPPKICILICKSGCFCKQGYYRAEDGKCVAPDQCCSDNEKYKTCGSSCIETCNYKPVTCKKPCVAGCFCGCSDYVRQGNSTGSPCIRRNKCPKAYDSTD